MWERFNFRFYSFAILFVLFDVEAIFLFPWAAQFGYLSKEFGFYILLEMLVFIAILFFGWLYAWKRGDNCTNCKKECVTCNDKYSCTKCKFT